MGLLEAGDKSVSISKTITTRRIGLIRLLIRNTTHTHTHSRKILMWGYTVCCFILCCLCDYYLPHCILLYWVRILLFWVCSIVCLLYCVRIVVSLRFIVLCLLFNVLCTYYFMFAFYCIVLYGGIITIYYCGFCSSFTLMIAHGLCSSGLFCLANISYERLSSRSLLIGRGLLGLIPRMSFW
jgi:hypothetical protein